MAVNNCISCDEKIKDEEHCPESDKECGHHCNHSWSHDYCCKCKTHIVDRSEDGYFDLPTEGDGMV